MSGFNTSLLHDGVDDYPNGATLVPIYQSSAFKHESAEELERIFDNKAMGFSYTRINNPTIEAFEKRITKLEKGFSSVACSSGMAAIFNSIANIVRQGDEVVASCGLYGGTVELFEDLESFGITVKYVADNKPECFEELITDKTRVVFAETIGNPKLDVTDIKAVADVAHAHGIPLIVDNTVSTPYLIQPITLGADVVVNSSSKYINGSSDAISGILTFNGKFKFDKEKYPGLESSPYHEVADKQFTKGYGAIITFRVGSKERAFKIINALKIPNIVSNIGDTKTLVIHPASTIALHLSDKDKEASGVYDDLIRVSVGIEDIDDLKEDFRAALESTDNE